MMPAPPHEAERLTVAETVRIPMAKMDSLLLQAEEILAVKLAANQHVADLQELRRSMGAWQKDLAKVLGEDGPLPAEHEQTGGPLAEQFLEWNHAYMRALDAKVAALAKTAETERHGVGLMVDNLLDAAKRLVMLPFGTLLEIFPKIVRDLSRTQGKEVELSIRGSEIEIDKRILEEMKDPLIHLVRNVIDHGIEKPDARTPKPRCGALTIAVSQQEGNKVEIVVADDGGGIDIGKVKASAVKNGLLSEEEAERCGEQEALALIFLSGVSTSPIVTDISGRGLGMAIVREKVEKLGGRIAIETKPRLGTTFRILLPVTLTTFKGVVVETSDQVFVISSANVERVVRLKRSEIRSVENREVIVLDGRVLSLVRLDDALELRQRKSGADDPYVLVVVLGAGEDRVAFSVDAVLNEQEVLVKNLGKLLARVRNVAAATVFGSGKVVPILNAADLLKSAARAGGATSEADGPGARPETRPPMLLVVDDSVTSRMLLKNILESAGCKVKTAIDGSDAWTALKTQEFDLVVTDIEMPRMNGFDLTSKIRADKELSELPVVLVTALEAREHRERGIEAGANAYIVKSSFDQSDLLDVIHRFVKT